VEAALSPGLHTVTAAATDAFGASAEDSITVQVFAGTGVPSATILSPADGLFVAPGTVITLQGQGTDPEEGILPGARLQWFSDRDGVLGTGTSLQVVLSGPAQACNPEIVSHRITLQVTDSDGHQVTEYITVVVGIIC
jgi:hypothetical protein